PPALLDRSASHDAFQCTLYRQDTVCQPVSQHWPRHARLDHGLRVRPGDCRHHFGTATGSGLCLLRPAGSHRTLVSKRTAPHLGPLSFRAFHMHASPALAHALRDGAAATDAGKFRGKQDKGGKENESATREKSPFLLHANALPSASANQP